jgi:hypothetical protein
VPSEDLLAFRLGGDQVRVGRRDQDQVWIEYQATRRSGIENRIEIVGSGIGVFGAGRLQINAHLAAIVPARTPLEEFPASGSRYARAERLRRRSRLDHISDRSFLACGPQVHLTQKSDAAVGAPPRTEAAAKKGRRRALD